MAPIAESNTSQAAAGRLELIRAFVNSADLDIERATSGTNSTVLVGTLDGELVATTMVGHDGHRGWVYYLAVDDRCRGFGRELMRASEAATRISA